MAISPIFNSYYQKKSVTAVKNHSKSCSQTSDKSLLSFKSSHKIVGCVKNSQVIPAAVAAVGGVFAVNSLVQSSKKVEGEEKLTYSEEYWQGYDTDVVRFANGKLKLRTTKDGTKLQEYTKDGTCIYNTESWDSYTPRTIIKYQNDGTPIERRLSSDNSLLQKWDENGVLIYDQRAKDPHYPPISAAMAAMKKGLASEVIAKHLKGDEGDEKLTCRPLDSFGSSSIVVRYDNGQTKLLIDPDGTKLEEYTKDGTCIYKTESWCSVTGSTVVTFKEDGTPIKRIARYDNRLLQKWNDNGELIYDQRAKDPHNPPKELSADSYGTYRKNAPSGSMTLEERMAKEKEWLEREKLYERKPSAAEIQYKKDLKEYNEGSWFENLGKTKPKPSDYGLVQTFCGDPILD